MKAAYVPMTDPIELRFWTRILMSLEESTFQNAVFFDVGANCGFYTIPIAETGIAVHAFEPNSMPRIDLKASILLNDFRNVEVHNCALGSTRRAAKLDSSQDSRAYVTDREIEGLHAKKRPETIEIVPVRTLDSFWNGEGSCFAKIDVEGYEEEVVRGAACLIASGQLKVIQLEWNDLSERTLGKDRRHLAVLLRDSNYILFRLANDGRLVAQQDSVVESAEDVFAIHSSFLPVLESIYPLLVERGQCQ